MAYAYYKTITIDKTKVSGGSDLSNFPVLVKIATDNDLRTVANGGHVQSNSGYDIVFAADSGGSSLLSFEREVYTASNGQFIAHVKVPTLSASSNTIIYLLYGDSGVTTEQGGTGAWNSNYKGVWHLNESSGNISDSTSNGKTMSSAGSSNYSQTGQIYKGIDTNADGDFGVSSVANLTAESYVNVEAICKLDTYQTYGMVFFHGANGGYVILRFDAPSTCLFYNVLTTGSAIASATGFTTGVWYHVFCRLRKGDKSYVMVNGVETSGTGGNYYLSNVYTEYASIGAFNHTTPSQKFDGIIDEVRLSVGDVGAGWATTSYNSLMSPSTFYSISAESAAGGGGTTALVDLIGGFGIIPFAR